MLRVAIASNKKKTKQQSTFPFIMSWLTLTVLWIDNNSLAYLLHYHHLSPTPGNTNILMKSQHPVDHQKLNDPYRWLIVFTSTANNSTKHFSTLKSPRTHRQAQPFIHSPFQRTNHQWSFQNLWSRQRRTASTQRLPTHSVQAIAIATIHVQATLFYLTTTPAAPWASGHKS